MWEKALEAKGLQSIIEEDIPFAIKSGVPGHLRTLFSCLYEKENDVERHADAIAEAFEQSLQDNNCKLTHETWQDTWKNALDLLPFLGGYSTGQGNHPGQDSKFLGRIKIVETWVRAKETRGYELESMGDTGKKWRFLMSMLWKNHKEHEAVFQKITQKEREDTARQLWNLFSRLENESLKDLGLRMEDIIKGLPEIKEASLQSLGNTILQYTEAVALDKGSQYGISRNLYIMDQAFKNGWNALDEEYMEKIMGIFDSTPSDYLEKGDIFPFLTSVSLKRQMEASFMKGQGSRTPRIL